MKDIHPQYYTDAQIICACGNVMAPIGSTKKEIRVEICSNCHPFYTGNSKLVDTTGRVERFHKIKKIFDEKSAAQTAKKPRKIRTAKGSGMTHADKSAVRAGLNSAVKIKSAN